MTHPCRYEPDLNPTYQDHGRALLHRGHPGEGEKSHGTKPRWSRRVLIAERWIIAALRNHTFFSIGELNRAIREKLEEFNNRPLQKLKVSRRHLFETIDKPAMKPLPERRYEYAEWEKHKVNIDYHVEVDRHYYSVPYQLRKEVVDARITATTVEIFFKGKEGGLPREELSFTGRHTTLSRPHARIPQALPGMDALPHREVGGEDGAVDGGARQGDHGEKAPPRAGLPVLPRHHAAGKALRRGKARGRLYPGPHLEGLLVQERRVDPQEQAGRQGTSREH